MPLIEESAQIILQCFNASHDSSLLYAAGEVSANITTCTCPLSNENLIT